MGLLNYTDPHTPRQSDRMCLFNKEQTYIELSRSAFLVLTIRQRKLSLVQLILKIKEVSTY